MRVALQGLVLLALLAITHAGLVNVYVDKTKKCSGKVAFSMLAKDKACVKAKLPNGLQVAITGHCAGTKDTDSWSAKVFLGSKCSGVPIARPAGKNSKACVSVMGGVAHITNDCSGHQPPQKPTTKPVPLNPKPKAPVAKAPTKKDAAKKTPKAVKGDSKATVVKTTSHKVTSVKVIPKSSLLSPREKKILYQALTGHVEVLHLKDRLKDEIRARAAHVRAWRLRHVKKNPARLKLYRSATKRIEHLRRKLHRWTVKYRHLRRAAKAITRLDSSEFPKSVWEAVKNAKPKNKTLAPPTKPKPKPKAKVVDIAKMTPEQLVKRKKKPHKALDNLTQSEKKKNTTSAAKAKASIAGKNATLAAPAKKPVPTLTKKPTAPLANKTTAAAKPATTPPKKLVIVPTTAAPISASTNSAPINIVPTATSSGVPVLKGRLVVPEKLVTPHLLDGATDSTATTVATTSTVDSPATTVVTPS